MVGAVLCRVLGRQLLGRELRARMTAGTPASIRQRRTSRSTTFRPTATSTADITAEPGLHRRWHRRLRRRHRGQGHEHRNQGEPLQDVRQGHRRGGLEAPHLRVRRQYVRRGQSLHHRRATPSASTAGSNAATGRTTAASPIVGHSTLALHVDVRHEDARRLRHHAESDRWRQPERLERVGVRQRHDRQHVSPREIPPGRGQGRQPRRDGQPTGRPSPRATRPSPGTSAVGGTGGGDHACTLCTDSVNSTGGGGGSGSTLTQSGGNNGKPTLTATGTGIDGKGGNAGCNGGRQRPERIRRDGCTWSDHGGQAHRHGLVVERRERRSKRRPRHGRRRRRKARATSRRQVVEEAAGAAGAVRRRRQVGRGGGGAEHRGSPSSSARSRSPCATSSRSRAEQAARAAPAQDGQLGGYAGAAVSPGCAGGIGGQGAKGGAGGGGSGGISVGVVYTDTKPTMDNTTGIVVPSNAAPKGTGGAAGVNGRHRRASPRRRCKRPARKTTSSV